MLSGAPAAEVPGLSGGAGRAWLAPLAVASAGVLLHLACGDRHGFFRDELYFVVCGQRLAWGYVDQPPLGPLLARAAWALSGGGASVLAFRLPAIALGAASALLAALLARRLGGGAFAMALAALAVAAAPGQVAQAHLVGMNALEPVLWTATALAVLAATSGRPRAWLPAGLLAGAGLLTKYSMAFLLLGLVAGLLATRARRALATPWIAAGVAAGVALALPNLLWQVDHGLPFLELVRNGQAHKNAPIGPGQLAAGVLLEQNPVGALLAAAGLAFLLAGRWPGQGEDGLPDPAPRWLGLGLGLVLAGLAALGAKPYYLGPAFPSLFAAGAVVAERSLRPRRIRGALAGALAAVAVPALPLAIPLLSPAALVAWQARLGVAPPRLERMEYGALPQHFADQIGWEERVSAVARAWAALPEEDRRRAVLYTTNYGRAAAADLFGPRLGLPGAISGHNTYFLWGAPEGRDVVLAWGGREEDYREDFAEVRRVGETPAIEWGLPYESGVPIFLLRGPRRPLPELWAGARLYI